MLDDESIYFEDWIYNNRPFSRNVHTVGILGLLELRPAWIHADSLDGLWNVSYLYNCWVC